MHFSTPHGFARTLITVMIVVATSACSSSDSGDDAATEAKFLDPNRASARALFDHIHSICNQEYPDAEAYYGLVHTETAKQKLWMDHIYNIDLPKYHFANACFERFGELPLIRGTGVWTIASFKWQTEGSDRAVIECVNDHGVKSPLHLVKIGDEWSISGYTFEYAKHIGFDHPRFEEFAQSLPGVGRYIDGVTARVRNGEFATLEDADKAWEAAVSQHGRDHAGPKS